MEPGEYRFGLGLDVQSLVKEKVKDLVRDLCREGKHGSRIGKAKAKAAFRVRNSQSRRTWLGGDQLNRIRIVSSEVAIPETVVHVVRIAAQHQEKMLQPALLRNQAQVSAHRRMPTECPVSRQLG
jgi:hypothetical protein